MTTAATDLAAPRSERVTLGLCAREFWSYPSPRIISTVIGVTLVLRLALGAWTWWDGVVAVGVLAYHPFNEWLVHRFALHMRPREIRGRTVDTLLARKHREHHQDPRATELVFLPTSTLLATVVVLSAVFLLAFPTLALAVQAMLALSVIGLAYEWTHYLVHTEYKPRSGLYRRIWRNHRLHHYKSEKYWFGFTSPQIDWLLRTAPDPGQVETSPTVRSLGIA